MKWFKKEKEEKKEEIKEEITVDSIKVINQYSYIAECNKCGNITKFEDVELEEHLQVCGYKFHRWEPDESDLNCIKCSSCNELRMHSIHNLRVTNKCECKVDINKLLNKEEK